MITMSPEWQATIGDQYTSRRCIAEMQISLGEAFVDNRFNLMVADPQPTTKKAQLNDEILHPEHKFAAFDGQWKLGDDKRLSSGVYMQTGYRGWTLCNASANFTTPQKISVAFLQPKSIDQIEVAFDPALNEYAVNFTVTFYNQQGAAITTWTISNNTEAIKLLTGAAVENVQRVEMSITRWSRANTFAKVTEFYAASEEAFTEADRIISIDINQQSESTSSMDVGGVYTAKATIVLDNSDGYFNVTDPYNTPYIRNKRIDLALGLLHDDGSRELCGMGAFYIDNLAQDANNVTVTITAQDIMREFEGKSYQKTPSLTYPATLAQIFEDAIIASGLPVTYSADAICSTITVPSEPAWGDNVNCRQVMRHLAQVVNGRAYQTRDGVIMLEANISENTFANPVLSIDPSVYFDMSGQTSDLNGVTRVMVLGANDASVLKAETDAEALIGIANYEIRQNPVFLALAVTPTSIHSSAAQSILDAYSYTTKVRTVNWRANPALEVGDVVQLMAMDAALYDSRVAQSDIKFAGGFRGTIQVRSLNVGKAAPTIRFYEQNGDLWYEITTAFAPFFNAYIDTLGNLTVNVFGPLSMLKWHIDESGYFVWSM